MPATRDLAGAHTWMRDHVEAGVEGVVVKHREHGYRPRRRSWFKVRARTTADAVGGRRYRTARRAGGERADRSTDRGQRAAAVPGAASAEVAVGTDEDPVPHRS